MDAVRQFAPQRVRMMTGCELDQAIRELENQMPDLQHLHKDVFAYANAWAVRHDAILAATPQLLRAEVEARLQRIGIRWGVAHGVRVTSQFPALKLPA
jgi:hypothetical protein